MLANHDVFGNLVKKSVHHTVSAASQRISIYWDLPEVVRDDDNTSTEGIDGIG